MDARQSQLRRGWVAFDREGERIGQVDEVGTTYLVIGRGLILSTNLYVPISAVREIDADRGHVHVDAHRSQIDAMGWDEPPRDDPATGEQRDIPSGPWIDRDDAEAVAGSTASMSGVGTQTNGNGLDGLGYDGRDEDVEVDRDRDLDDDFPTGRRRLN